MVNTSRDAEKEKRLKSASSSAKIYYGIQPPSVLIVSTCATARFSLVYVSGPTNSPDFADRTNN